MEPRNEVTLYGVVKMEPMKRSFDRSSLTTFVLNTDPEKTQKAREEIRITCWDSLAIAADDIKAGDWVLVMGRIQERRYKDNRTDEWRSSWELLAERVEPVRRDVSATAMARETADRTGDDDEPFDGQF